MDDGRGTLKKIYEGEFGGGINAVQPRHTVFSSLYSALSATVPTEIPVGNGVVLKSDLPLIVRIGKKEPIRNVFDLTINTSLDYFSILPQVTGTFIDCQVNAYSIFPAKYLKRWQRVPKDYPNCLLVTNLIFGAADSSKTASSTALTPNPANFVSENLFIQSIYLRETAQTGAPAAANVLVFRIIDQQAAPQDVFRTADNTAISGVNFPSFINPVQPIKVALPFTLRLDISAAPGVGTDRTFEVDLNCKFR